MQTRELGKSGLRVSAIGLGCMGMSEFYGPGDEAQSLETLKHALESGVFFWDTADIYGGGKSEEFLGAALIMHCSEKSIPIPRGAERSLMVRDGELSLYLRIEERASEPAAALPDYYDYDFFG